MDTAQFSYWHQLPGAEHFNFADAVEQPGSCLIGELLTAPLADLGGSVHFTIERVAHGVRRGDISTFPLFALRNVGNGKLRLCCAEKGELIVLPDREPVGT